jgi:hypothetical protein
MDYIECNTFNWDSTLFNAIDNSIKFPKLSDPGILTKIYNKISDVSSFGTEPGCESIPQGYLNLTMRSLKINGFCLIPELRWLEFLPYNWCTKWCRKYSIRRILIGIDIIKLRNLWIFVGTFGDGCGYKHRYDDAVTIARNCITKSYLPSQIKKYYGNVADEVFIFNEQNYPGFPQYYKPANDSLKKIYVPYFIIKVEE